MSAQKRLESTPAVRELAKCGVLGRAMHFFLQQFDGMVNCAPEEGS
jgi:hypothetical protein